MHIPDGFLDTKVVVATATFSVAGVATAWHHTRAHVPPGRVPLLGLSAAFVFAAQMLNFPVAGGTSGHLMGAVLICLLLGPSAAVIVMTAVLVVQCFIFADGGVLALGANVFNMAIVGTMSGYLVYRLLSRAMKGETGRFIAVAFASWCSVVVASICCAGELAWSGTVSWSAAFPAMAGVHMLIGVGEGLITALVFAAISKVRPELIYSPDTEVSSLGYRPIIVYGTIVTLGLVLFVSPFASSWPDGLERVAATLGFDQLGINNRNAFPAIPDYRFPGIGSETLATILGGVIGVILVFILASLLVRATSAARKWNLRRQSTDRG